MSVTHIAAPHVTIDGRYRRQRCAWCEAVLAEYDLSRIAVPVGTDPDPGHWPEGALITVDGNASWIEEAEGLPDDACARNPLTFASLTGTAGG